MSEVFEVVLLNALPASGKSEVRNFMMQMDGETLIKDFHIGENLQLDDFPYVHFMRRIDQELVNLGQERMFYISDEDPFIDGRDWATLINMLNEDYHDLLNRTKIEVESVAQYTFDRLDRAGQVVGIKPRLALLNKEVREKLALVLEKDAQEVLDTKVSQYRDSYENMTIVIESARGGKDGSSMPLEGTEGYQYYYRFFAPDLLEKAAILYIWVSPEESRRKNAARFNPDDPGSNLFHGTPLAVMMNDYGCDDMQYLIENSEKENTITVKTYDKTYYLPIGVFDNRVDKTTFMREDKENWDPELVTEVTAMIKQATDNMWKNYNK